MPHDANNSTATLDVQNIIHPLSGQFCVNLTGLEEFNNYTIEVEAINGAGAGPMSTPIMQSTGPGRYTITNIAFQSVLFQPDWTATV